LVFIFQYFSYIISTSIAHQNLPITEGVQKTNFRRLLRKVVLKFC
jgi:hypothetical protein